RGPWITASYYQDPAPEKFHDGWLCTGDVGSLDPEGFVRLTDRAKDVIKSGGEWISSMELENLLMAHPGVAEAAVIGVPDEAHGEAVHAYVVREPDSAVTEDELIRLVHSHLNEIWVPRTIEFVESLPTTAIGKVNTRALRERYASAAIS
ncbi:MAG TPA: hypothetical protein VGD84_25060, partial [Pseudonocardiaceae bacterium]